MQEPLFYADLPDAGAYRQLAAKDDQIAAMQAAAAGMRELRAQQAETIKKQQAEILELRQTVKRLSSELKAAR